MRQKLDQMGIEDFVLDRENAHDWNKNLPDLHFVNMKMATWLKPDPYSGEINPVSAEGWKSSSAATKKRNDNKKFTVKRDNVKFFMGAKLQTPNNFGWESLMHLIMARQEDFLLLCLKMIWLQFLGSLSVTSENLLMVKKHLFYNWKDFRDYEYDGPTVLVFIVKSVNLNNHFSFACLEEKTYKQHKT